MGAFIAVEIPMPDIFTRQGSNAQGPLSSCYHFWAIMCVAVPAIFGIRMCFNCPDCNADRADPSNLSTGPSCTDYRGLATQP